MAVNGTCQVVTAVHGPPSTLLRSSTLTGLAKLRAGRTPGLTRLRRKDVDKKCPSIVSTRASRPGANEPPPTHHGVSKACLVPLHAPSDPERRRLGKARRSRWVGAEAGSGPEQGVPPELAEEGGDGPADVGFLEKTIRLPGGQVMSRRDALRSLTLFTGLASTWFTLTHLKALQYASPQAMVNLLLGGNSPLANAGQALAGGSRVADLEAYIADLERRGGGRQVPDFARRLQWLNAAPLSLQRELKGKVVVLDFWTYCCINCMHVLPDLAFIESKFKGQPVAVVGVHSAKFDNEKDVSAVRNAVLRYDVTHPVVNDGEMTMWRALGVSSWPTLALVSPGGKLIGMLAGEGHRQDLDDLLQAALKYYGEKGQLDLSPVPEALEKDKDSRLVKSPLRYPGKIATDLANGRLFISDSNNHRIVVTDLEGKFLSQVGGAGGEGLRDGSFEFAAFNRPQGLAYNPAKDVLYVADTENHALREIDFGRESVRTLAGDGQKGADYVGGKAGPAQELNSPWDVALDPSGRHLYIAMAGQHQIWRHNIADGVTAVFSGSGYERNQNAARGIDAAYAQPSGLSFTASGKEMLVADSESSSIRAVDVETAGARSCAGGDPLFADNLFQFGDRDGQGSKARLQHPLAVLCSADSNIAFVADSYNHRIKLLDLKTNEIKAVAGSGIAGFQDGAGFSSQLSEPAGLALGPQGKVFVADTNNSVIRVLEATAGGRPYSLSTLSLSAVPPPSQAAPAGSKPRRLRRRQVSEAEVIQVAPVKAARGRLQLQVSIPANYHFTKGAISRFDADVDEEWGVQIMPASGELQSNGLQASASLGFDRSAASAKGATSATTIIRLNCKVYYCQLDEVCLYKAVTFEVPLVNDPEAEEQDMILAYTVVPKVVNTTGFVQS